MTQENFTDLGLSFDKVAQLYDAVRPGYPSLLFEDLLNFSKIKPSATILDIGCGTGKSTKPLASRGFSIYALDPGDSMLNICQKNLSEYRKIKYVNSSFETWSPNGTLFDLIVSGTAFHWVDEMAYQKLASMLTPNGAIGIFWHTYLKSDDNQFDEICRDHAPSLYSDDIQVSLELGDKKREEQMLSITGFDNWRVVRYYDHMRYNSTSYVGLLRTWSSHTNLPES